MTKQVYLDNGATTRVDDKVVEAMKPYFTEVYGNASSIHSFGEKAKEALDKARETFAKAINADPKEIVFTSGGTESDNLAIKGIAYAQKDKGNHIITCKTEHHAVIYTCDQLSKEGFQITYLDVDSEGLIDFEKLEKAITDKTILITIMHANNEVGTVQDIKKIGEIAKKHKVFFHTDAVQSFTKEPIDVKEMNVDLISFSSHKIHGPKGVGALFVKKGTLLKKQSEGGHHEFNKRAGTENVPGIVGFAEAVKIAAQKDNERVKELRDHLIDSVLSEIPESTLNGPKNNRLCNNANIRFKYIEGESLLLHLNDKGIAVSTGSACTSDSLEPSHVLVAMGIPHEEAHGSIRFTLSKHTTKEEIDFVVKELSEIVGSLRKMSPLGHLKKDYTQVIHTQHH